MSLQGLTKSSASTLTPMYKGGSGWAYDDASLAYDSSVFPDGRVVTYDGVGTAPTLIGQSKSSAGALTPLTKNAA